MIVALEQSGDAIRAVFRPAENEDGIVIHSLKQLDQQVGFLRIGNWIDDVLDRFGGRAPISIVSGLCIAHWMSVSICGGTVAENNAVWRWRGHLSTMRRTSGRNPMSSIRSASSRTRN